MISKNKKVIKKNSYTYNFDYSLSSGMFFIYNEINSEITRIKTCREQFSEVFYKKYKYIGFYCDNLNIKLLNEFFSIIENKLKLKERDKITFFNTNFENAIIMKLSNFWVRNLTVRNFLTLFIRCGAVYYKKKLQSSFDEFDVALINYKLTNSIKPTIEWFLDGHVKPTYPYNRYFGAVNYFRHYNKEQLKRLLVKP